MTTSQEKVSEFFSSVSGRYTELFKEAHSMDLSPLVKTTDLTFLPQLSKRLGSQISLKREDQQTVFSFKIRGAFAKMQTLSEDERSRGVICASAGNHAQGVAVAAAYFNTHAQIVMPVITPEIKIEAVKRLGAEVVLLGSTFDGACAEAKKLAATNNRTFIHPYDDEKVILGQSTVGLEIFSQQQDTDYVYVPIGGGGLAAGIALVCKHLRPACKIIGVEAEESASMSHAFSKSGPAALSNIGRFAEGVAVKEVGNITYGICRDLLDEIITVNNDEICAATQDIYEDARVIAEPAGAIALAGIKKHLTMLSHPPGKVVGVLSGANVNFNRLRYIAERADLGEQKEAIFAVTIPEETGSFLNFCRVIGERSITEFNYRYSNENEAHVFVGIALKNGNMEKQSIFNALTNAGYATLDLSENETAKTHIRYMVGGRAQQAENEKLYRFSFPEQPGALLGFLTQMASRWNISLFHYRNHGSDFGRVLLGIQVPEHDHLAFSRFINNTRFNYINESDNPVYHLFL